MALPYLATVVAFWVTAVLYYRGALWAASLCGLAFGVLATRTLYGAVGPIAFAVIGGLLIVGPGGLVMLHAVDVRKGLCLWPTIYSIPLAFLSGLLLIMLTGVVLLLP